MRHEYQYVSKEEYMPVKKELEELIHLVQDELRDEFTFSYSYVGSSHRKMITRDLKGNAGYDFDVNLHVNDDEEEFSAEEIRRMVKNAFDRHVKRFGYDYCEEGMRVLTIKKKDVWHSRIISSCDFAVVYDCEDGRQQYIHFNKDQKAYVWRYLPQSNQQLEQKADRIKKAGAEAWNEVLQVYLDKKNANEDPDKKSRSLYAETINEVYMRWCR